MKLSLAALFFLAGCGILHAQQGAETPVKKEEPQNVLTEEEKQIRLRLALADSLKKEGRNDEALALYREFTELHPESAFINEARRSIAALLEGRQNYKAAADTWQLLFEELGVSDEGLECLFQRSRLQEKMGMNSEAQAGYRMILSEKPESHLARAARTRLSLAELVPE